MEAAPGNQSTDVGLEARDPGAVKDHLLPSWWTRLWVGHLRGLVLAPAVAAEARASTKRSTCRDLIVACQHRRLKGVVRHAINNVPFYRAYYTRAGVRPEHVESLADLGRLPLLTKDHLRRYLPALIADNRPLTFAELRQTSGTTGVALDVVVSLASQLYTLAKLEARLPQLGLRSSDFRFLAPTYLYLSHTEPDPRFRRWSQRLPIFRLARFEKRDFRQEFAGDLRALLEELWRMRPVYVHGKPTSLCAFAEMSARLDPEGRFRLRPKVVVTGAEELTPRIRAFLAGAYQCPVFDSYGLQEVGTVACECTARNGLHVEDDATIVEILRDGKPVPPLEAGEVVVTNLCDWTMPILRYRTGDIARMTCEPCECGLAYPRLMGLEGRVVDFFVTARGEVVHPFSLIGRLRSLDLAQYQLVQRSPLEVVVRYVGDLPEGEVRAAVESAVHSAMGDDVRVDAERVSALDRPGKKTRAYVREFQPPGAGNH